MRFRGQLHLYKVVGRGVPTEKNRHPQVFQMRIYAPDHIVAKSRFWHFLKRLKKVKNTQGEVLEVTRINENPNKVKTYGIWLRFTARSGENNMYKEYREVTSAGAVTQCYREMGGQHRASADSISIIRVETLADDKVRRPQLKQFLEKKLRFPMPRMRNAPRHKPRFTTSRVSTFVH